MTVSDAKSLLTTDYPKFGSRLNVAFHGFANDESIKSVVDKILADVSAWAASFPDNVKTSSLNISRPKCGLLHVLKDDKFRASLGIAYCTEATDAINRAWKDVQSRHVTASAVVKETHQGDVHAIKGKRKSKNKNNPAASANASASASSETIVNTTETKEDDDEEEDTVDDLRSQVHVLKASNEFLAASLIAQIKLHYDPIITSIVSDLIGNPNPRP
jgi:hypothetical protein